MDRDLEIQRLLAIVAEAERQRDEAKKERDETENERKQVQQKNVQLEQENQFQQPTNLLLYDPIFSGTSVTRVDGKFYPFRLHPWEEFPRLQRREFDHLKSVLKDEPLFPSYIGVREMQRRACETPVASEATSNLLSIS